MNDRAQSSASRVARRDDNKMRQLPSQGQENARLQQVSSAGRNVVRGRETATSLRPPSKNEPVDRLPSVSTTVRHSSSQKTYAPSRSATGLALVDITHRAASDTTTTATNTSTLDSRRTTTNYMSTVSKTVAAPIASQAVSYVKGSTYTDRIQAYHGKSTGYVPPSAPTARSTSFWTTSFTAPVVKDVTPCTTSVDKSLPLISRISAKKGAQKSSVIEEEQSSGEGYPDGVSMVAFNSLHRPTPGALTAVTAHSTSKIISDQDQMDTIKQEVRVAVRRGGQRQRYESTSQGATKEESLTEIEYPRRHAPVGVLPSSTVHCEPLVNKYSSVTSRSQLSSHIPVPIRHTKRAYSYIEQSSSSASTISKLRPSFPTATAFSTTFLSGRTQSLPKQPAIDDGVVLAPPVKRQRANEANVTVVNDIRVSTTNATEQAVVANKGTDTGIPHIRLSEDDGPAYVTEYSNDIFEHFREMEILLAPDFSYLWSRSDEFWRQRQSWIEVMSQICLLVDACNETLFLAVNLLDRALSRNFAVCQSPEHVLYLQSSADLVSTSHLANDKNQILAITCVLIAAKYEERNRQSMACVYENYVNQLRISIDAETFRRGEREILAFLDYRLGWPGPLSFLRRCSMADSGEFWARAVAKYILEAVLFDQRLLIHKPSMQAAAALNIGRRMMGRLEWTNRLVRESGYTATELTPAVNDMLRFLRDPVVPKTTPFNKYMKYSSIPRLVDGWIRDFFKTRETPRPLQ